MKLLFLALILVVNSAMAAKNNPPEGELWRVETRFATRGGG